MSPLSLSDAKLARFRKVFRLFDVNGDGHIDENDLFLFADRLAAMRSASRDEARASLQPRFAALLRADSDGDGVVTEAEYLAHCAREYVGRDHFSDGMREFVRGVFTAYDVDGDGVIGFGDYCRVHLAFGLDPRLSDVQRRFQTLDLNRNGELEWSEWLATYERFFLSEDPAAPSFLCLE